MTSELQDRYRDSLRSRIEVLEDAISRLDEDDAAEATIRRLAHVLKGSGGTYGFPEITERGEAAEDADEEELASKARALLEVLRSVVEAESERGEAVVLVVEDDPEVRYLLSYVLEQEGRTVRAAGTGAEARAVLDEGAVDLVILDLFLPDTDGRNLLMKLREAPSTAHLPVIIISTRTSERIKAECFALGCDVFFEKPFDPDTLISAVGSQLDRAADVDREARRDSVTGLLNRAGLRDAVESLESGPLSLVMLEVDGFDALEEEYGPATGERVLVEVGGAVAEVVEGSSARGARWQGSQFAVLLPGGEDRASELAEELLEGVRSLTVEDPEGESFRVTVSVGVAEETGEPEDERLDPLLSRARAVLHRAREAGGNRIGDTEGHQEAMSQVLVAEDDDLTATLLIHRLERHGYEVLRYVNGAEAYEAALDIAPELVILDVKMPGMDGFELLERLRKIPAYQDVPIMMLTSMGNESDVVRGFELGADDYVLKPFSPTELMARVQRLVRSS